MIQQIPLNFKEGARLRDRGINRAADNAERVHGPGWQERAIGHLINYPEAEFMAEEVRIWAHSQGLEEPPSARAWGAVIVTAKRRGIIRSNGYRKVSNPLAHSTPASVWLKVPLAAISSERYRKLIVDGKIMKVIIMIPAEKGFILPEQYHRLIGKKGVEIVPASNDEAAEYLHKKWPIPGLS